MGEHDTMRCPWCSTFMVTWIFPKHMHECQQNPHTHLLTLLARQWVKHHPGKRMELREDFDKQLTAIMARVVSDPDVAYALVHHWYADEDVAIDDK